MTERDIIKERFEEAAKTGLCPICQCLLKEFKCYNCRWNNKEQNNINDTNDTRTGTTSSND